MTTSRKLPSNGIGSFARSSVAYPDAACLRDLSAVPRSALKLIRGEGGAARCQGTTTLVTFPSSNTSFADPPEVRL